MVCPFGLESFYKGVKVSSEWSTLVVPTIFFSPEEINKKIFQDVSLKNYLILYAKLNESGCN